MRGGVGVLRRGVRRGDPRQHGGGRRPAPTRSSRGFNQAFVEYAQARGFVIDPARVRTPAGQAPGGADGAVRARLVLRRRDLRRPRRRPAPGRGVVPRAGRAARPRHHPVPARPSCSPPRSSPGCCPRRRAPYDLPVYAHAPRCTAIITSRSPRRSTRSRANLIGARVEVRADRQLVRVFHRGQLVKVHPRQPARAGGHRPRRPARRRQTAYAMRDIDHLQRLAADARPGDRRLRRGAVGHPLPWTKMRQVYALLGLVKQVGRRPGSRRPAPGRWRPRRSTSPLIGRMLERGTESHDPPAQPAAARHGRRPGSPATPATSPSTPRPAQTRQARNEPRRAASRHPRAAGAAAPGQARPLPRHPPRTARPGPAPASWATPSSSSSSSPTRSPAARPPPPTARARAAGLDPAMTPGPLGRHRQGHLRPRRLERAVLAAVRRRRPQRRHHGPRRRRQDLPGHRPRPRRRPPPLQRPLRTRDRLLKRLRASRLDNSHDAEMRKLLRVDLLILDDFALQPLDAARHRRHLRAHRRTPPRRRHRSSPPTANPIEWLGLDGRPAPRPVRHRPAPVRRLRTRPRRRVLPAPPKARHQPHQRHALTPTTADPAIITHADADTPTKWSHPTGARVVPSSWRATRTCSEHVTPGQTRFLG